MSDNLQYRLYNASIDPPVDAWPGIASQLDAEIQSQQRLSQKLQQAALEPPAFIWQNILQELDGTESSTTPVIPIKRNWRRIAVAAITIGIIALGAVYFISGDSGAPPVSKVTPDESIPKSENSSAPVAQQKNTKPDIKKDDAAIPQPKYSFAGRTTAKPGIRYASVNNASVDAQQVNVDGAIEEPVSTESDHYVRRSNYLTIAAPNGQPAKLSSKLIDAASYVIMNEPADNFDGVLRSISWKRRLQNWSNKIISSPAFMPTATNFLDIVELEELLKEQ